MCIRRMFPHFIFTIRICLLFVSINRYDYGNQFNAGLEVEEPQIVSTPADRSVRAIGFDEKCMNETTGDDMQLLRIGFKGNEFNPKDWEDFHMSPDLEPMVEELMPLISKMPNGSRPRVHRQFQNSYMGFHEVRVSFLYFLQRSSEG